MNPVFILPGLLLIVTGVRMATYAVMSNGKEGGTILMIACFAFFGGIALICSVFNVTLCPCGT